jgi:hypothetical protein
MLQRLFEKLRPWAEAVAALDDPHGEYFLMLEDRVSRLEGEVGRLRGSVKTEAGAAMTPTSGAETERRRRL